MDKLPIVLIGAGPAGLAAAWELTHARFDVTILESDPVCVGGLARTLDYNGFRFDIGAHRFFTKNSEIGSWWLTRLPNDFIRIKRLTRILYRGRFFDYPLRAGNALSRLGLWTSAACVCSYLKRKISPITPERSFKDWVSNRFGDRLFNIFFRTYTEKVWGMPCSEISSDWASQRIKGLSLWEAICNAFAGKGASGKVAKTLIDEFDYPRLGAGMLWEKVRDEVLQQGGKIFMGRTVVRFEREGNRVLSVTTRRHSGELEQWKGDSFIASMPLQDCVLAMDPCLRPEVQTAAKRLAYRDFLLVILIVNRRNIFPDNWIYVHAPEVKVGRIENFNNWGESMVPDRNVTCLEFEYFCSKGDSLWTLNDSEMANLAKCELEILGFAKSAEVLDTHVVRIEKAYPVYDAEYQRNIHIIRQELDAIENLQPIGRNGMHKYNNQDHSILTGILAARNLAGNSYNVWNVNTDAEYQETAPLGNDTARLMPTKIEESSTPTNRI
jgi:protoporphyrinogen oxidase